MKHILSVLLSNIQVECVMPSINYFPKQLPPYTKKITDSVGLPSDTAQEEEAKKAPCNSFVIEYAHDSEDYEEEKQPHGKFEVGMKRSSKAKKKNYAEWDLFDYIEESRNLTPEQEVTFIEKLALMTEQQTVAFRS